MGVIMTQNQVAIQIGCANSEAPVSVPTAIHISEDAHAYDIYSTSHGKSHTASESKFPSS